MDKQGRRAWRVAALTVAVALALSCGAIVALQYMRIGSYARTVRPLRSDAIIVLGAQVWGDKPSPALRERCDWALMLYRKGYAPRLILTGGFGSGTVTEAAAAASWLAARGVPRTAMLLDPASRDTQQNLADSWTIMRRHGWRTAVIVTDDFHQERAQALAARLPMQTSGYAGHSRYLFYPYYALREAVAYLVEIRFPFLGVLYHEAS